MKLYDCKVRLRGNPIDEVMRSGVTDAEIRILRSVHGGEDAVVEVTDAGATDRSAAEERDRLCFVYGDKIVDAMFETVKSRIDDEPAPAKPKGRPPRAVQSDLPTFRKAPDAEFDIEDIR